MTPEREAQMREMFQKKYGKRPTNDPLLEATWDDRKRVWDYCLNSLEPMVRDAERYRWLLANWHDGKGCWCDSLYAPKDLTKAIDAAMSAALEDGNATE